MGTGTNGGNSDIKASLISRVADWLLQQGSAVVVSVAFLGAVIYGATWALPYTINEMKAIQSSGLEKFEKISKQQQDYDRERSDRDRAHHEQVVRMILERRPEVNPSMNAGS